MISLRVVDGPRAGDTIEVGETLTIGRHSADVLLDDERLSRLHVKLTPEDDCVLVEDLGSTNGTVVDDIRIDRPTRAGEGSMLCFGASVAEVVIVREARSATIADPAATRAVEPLTVAGAVQAEPAPATLEPVKPFDASAAEPPVAERRPAPAADSPEVLVGLFNPPAVRHSRGLATRSWVPVALSYGTAILAAIALVIYFAQR